jgi:tRNA (cytidine/uridine-2'-O-)-methyltransferase
VVVVIYLSPKPYKNNCFATAFCHHNRDMSSPNVPNATIKRGFFLYLLHQGHYKTIMRLALYQPDIAPNVGTLLRLGACLNIPVDIIEPCGFPFGAKDLRRAVMDYADSVDAIRHSSWHAFLETTEGSRLVLLTTKAATPYTEFEFLKTDILLMGRESAGVPDQVHEKADSRVVIPMSAGMRSVNVAIAAAMVVGEALRQTNSFPIPAPQPIP